VLNQIFIRTTILIIVNISSCDLLAEIWRFYTEKIICLELNFFLYCTVFSQEIYRVRRSRYKHCRSGCV